MQRAILLSLTLLLPAPAFAEPYAPAFFNHNGSVVELKQDGNHVEIRYTDVRPGLPVRRNALLFTGTIDAGNNYVGTAFTFKRGCAPAPYAVAGRDMNGDVVLIGAAPHWDRGSCAVLGETTSTRHSRLYFEALIGD